MSTRWIAASRWSGVVDFRPLILELGGREGFERASLQGSSSEVLRGLPPRLLEALRPEGEVTSPHPFVLLGDPAYPARLLDLPKPPPALWMQGSSCILDVPAVAVVGARSCTSYGTATARRLGQAVAIAGGLLVSGAARGIDAAAHLGAMDSAGPTVAVLGAGLSWRPPSPAAELHRRIIASGGLLLSEMAPDDPPSKFSFPRRNRVIAALAGATVVVEAAERSGALHTAGFARDLGRDVFAVPGRIDAPASVGALRLIEEGAGILRHVGQVAELVQDHARRLDGPMGRLRRALERPGSLMEVATSAGLDCREAARQLSQMELAGLVLRTPDHRYVLRQT